MSVTGIILAAVIVGGTGLFIGVFLGVAGKKFAVEVDEREEAILGVLPGNNCGGCGYAGCSGLAAAIVKGEAEVGGCPVPSQPHERLPNRRSPFRPPPRRFLDPTHARRLPERPRPPRTSIPQACCPRRPRRGRARR